VRIIDTPFYAHRYNARILGVVEHLPEAANGVGGAEHVEGVSTNGVSPSKQYRVQLIDQDMEGIDDCIRIVTSDTLK
jgi:hypothetical protein